MHSKGCRCCQSNRTLTSSILQPRVQKALGSTKKRGPIEWESNFLARHHNLCINNRKLAFSQPSSPHHVPVPPPILLLLNAHRHQVGLSKGHHDKTGYSARSRITRGRSPLLRTMRTQQSSRRQARYTDRQALLSSSAAELTGLAGLGSSSMHGHG